MPLDNYHTILSHGKSILTRVYLFFRQRWADISTSLHMFVM